MTPESVQIVEVGPRDGFQSISPLIPTGTKIALIDGLYAAGIRRIEATAFVSKTVVPQMADAPEVLAAAQALCGLDVQVLVANLRNAERALTAGARHLAFVLSVSEKHNWNNVRCTPMESVGEYSRIAAALGSGIRVRLNLATAFDCPFDGMVSIERTVALLDLLIPVFPKAEICPCDTTGRVTPDRVSALFGRLAARFPQVTRWAYHGHDTYGLEVANAIAAWKSGVNIIDASFAGLGGCPFAPGATGNVATEDIVWAFESMGVSCGVHLDQLLIIAQKGAALSGALSGGRVRNAMAARLRAENIPAP